MHSGYEPHLWDGCSFHPTLYLDDVSEIPFLVNIAGVEEYQHRAWVRAGEGDLVAAVTPLTRGYEEYCRENLRLGAPDLVLAEPRENLLAVAEACWHGKAFAKIVERARAGNGLLIHPYMSVEPVWELARRVSAAARVPVQVLGPPPPVTWIANDKLRFSELVEHVLGKERLVRTESARDPRTLAGHLLDIGRRYPRVGLKRTRCASAMGNAVFRSEELSSQEHTEALVRSFLERTEWDGREEVLAVAWEEAEVSPSSQTWIPPTGKGEPTVEGIYEQILEGEEKIFVGSRPSTLAKTLNRRLTGASLRCAEALQNLGYVGRCSFDLLVVDGEQIRFTECNGRWGGTSIPMSLVDRLVGRPRPPYRAQDVAHPGLVGAPFRDVLRAIESDPRFVLYNVGPLAQWGKLAVIAFGASQPEADEALTDDLPRLLGVK